MKQISDITSSMLELFELHRSRLPIAIYYSSYIQGVRYIRFHKFLKDHIDGVQQLRPKYSASALVSVKNRLVDQLNQMEEELKGRKENGVSNIDVGGIEGIDWRKV